MLYALLATLGVKNLYDEANHGKEIRKINTGIDQLIYRIIKLENGINARRAQGKVRGYKNLSYRVSALDGEQKYFLFYALINLKLILSIWC